MLANDNSSRSSTVRLSSSVNGRMTRRRSTLFRGIDSPGGMTMSRRREGETFGSPIGSRLSSPYQISFLSTWLISFRSSCVLFFHLFFPRILPNLRSNSNRWRSQRLVSRRTEQTHDAADRTAEAVESAELERESAAFLERQMTELAELQVKQKAAGILTEETQLGPIKLSIANPNSTASSTANGIGASSSAGGGAAGADGKKVVPAARGAFVEDDDDEEEEGKKKRTLVKLDYGDGLTVEERERKRSEGLKLIRTLKVPKSKESLFAFEIKWEAITEVSLLSYHEASPFSACQRLILIDIFLLLSPPLSCLRFLTDDRSKQARSSHPSEASAISRRDRGRRPPHLRARPDPSEAAAFGTCRRGRTGECFLLSTTRIPIPFSCSLLCIGRMLGSSACGEGVSIEGEGCVG
jgi:hypothetical protein